MIQSNGQNERCEDEDAVHELKNETKYRFIQLVHMLKYCLGTILKKIVFCQLYLMENRILIDDVDN